MLSPGSYTIDHATGAQVFGGNGKVRLFTRHGTVAGTLKHDLQLVLAPPAG
jgi:cytochrome oxidase Cu insertion factor (SCO1/SenC/PrrC family)